MHQRHYVSLPNKTGRTEPMYVHSKSLGGYLVYGCHCSLTSATCCCDRLTPNDKSPLTPATGYTKTPGRGAHTTSWRTQSSTGELSDWNCGPRSVSAVSQTPTGATCTSFYVGLILGGKPWTGGNESFHTWLEDCNRLIYDHTSSHSIELRDICGAARSA